MAQVTARLTALNPVQIGHRYQKVFQYPKCEFVTMNHNPQEETLEIIFKCPGDTLSLFLNINRLHHAYVNLQYFATFQILYCALVKSLQYSDSIMYLFS